MGRTWRLALAVAGAAACGKSSPAKSDAAPPPDLATAIDTAAADARPDAPPDAVPDAPPPPPVPVLQGTFTYVKASNTHTGDHFGASIALSSDGTTLAVGAPQESTIAAESGGVYIYVWSGSAWSFQTEIKASNAGAGDLFGYAVALSSDGNTLAVGAPNEGSCAAGIDGSQTDNACGGMGAVYVLARSGTTWTQQAYVKPSNTSSAPGYGFAFGNGVALSADGNTLAVGAPGESGASTGIDGEQTFYTAARSGAVYVFGRSAGAWSQQAYVKASNAEGADQFGYSVALSADASVMAIGANAEASAARGIGGSQLDNHAAESGAVYTFRHSSAGWVQTAYVKASNTGAMDHFGTAVALSGDGATLAVGAPDEDSNATGIDGNESDDSQPFAGAVYVFASSQSSWTQQAYVKAAINVGIGRFGSSIAFSTDGNTLAIGDAGDNRTGTGITTPQTTVLSYSGAAYVFGRSGRSWYQLDYIKASNPDMNDAFGIAVSLGGDASTLAVGSYNESSSATGVGGNASDNSVSNAGAAYVIR